MGYISHKVLLNRTNDCGPESPVYREASLAGDPGCVWVLLQSSCYKAIAVILSSTFGSKWVELRWSLLESIEHSCSKVLLYLFPSLWTVHMTLISRETVVSLATGPLERLYIIVFEDFFFFKKNDGCGSGQQVLIALYFFSSKKLKVSPTSPVASKHSRSVLSCSVVSDSWRPHGLWPSGSSGHGDSPG